jgi:hypothetical protein
MSRDVRLVAGHRAITAVSRRAHTWLSPRRAAGAYVFLAKPCGRASNGETVLRPSVTRSRLKGRLGGHSARSDQPLAFYLSVSSGWAGDAAKVAWARALLRPAWTAVSLQVAQVLEFQKLSESHCRAS